MKQIINQKLMVFESSPDFSDNSRGLWEYVNKNTDYETFWIVKDEKMVEALKEAGVNCDLEGGNLANQMIANAHFLITSSFNFTYQKRLGQIHVAAWHGFPLKLIGFFESASADPQNFDMLKVITTQSDIITATSRLSQLTLSGLFAVDPRKVKETGFPRNDIMFWVDGKAELKKLTNINVEKSKLIFYLPTMRKGLKKEGAQFENNIFNYPDYDVEKLDKFLEEHDAYIFTKVHFADNELYEKSDFKLPKRMLFLDTYTLNRHFLTIYHIMNAFDVLVTDYSSVYVDFLLLDKPIIFSCSDLMIYQEDRGFVVDDPTLLMPGPIVKTQDQFINNLEDIFNGNDLYCTVRNEKMAFFHLYKDANSSKRLLEEMEYADRNGIKDSGKDIGKYFLDNNSPLSQYVRIIKAEFYFERGEEFNENIICKRYYNIGNEDSNVSFELDIPKDSKKICFVPSDLERCIMRNFSVMLDNQVVEYEIINGERISDCVFLNGIKSQIIIPLGETKYNKIKVRFQSIDLYNNIGKVVGELNKELMTVYSSNSWKITRPFRRIGSIVKKILNGRGKR